MNRLSAFQRLVMSHTVLLGLIVLAFLPEEEPYNNTSTLGWGLYFAITAIALVFAIRSWIEVAEHKRNQFRWRSFQDSVRFMTDEEYEQQTQDWFSEFEDDPFRDDNEPNNKRGK